MIIYYPYYDLINRGLINKNVDHILNIKLLLLLADKVLLLTSHLLNSSIIEINALSYAFHDFVADGKIVTVLYEGQNSVEDYTASKVEQQDNRLIRDQYILKSDLLLRNLFDCKPEIIQVDNSQERKQFQSLYTETNIALAKESKNKTLIQTALLFQEELQNRTEREGTSLHIDQINKLIIKLVKEKKISRNHSDFLFRNQVGAYYYCGSIAHSSVVAYNPYFLDINFGETTKNTPYHSSRAFSPEFLLNLLLGLHIINSKDDIRNLSNKDIDIIRNSSAWSSFQSTFNLLQDEADILSLLLSHEQNVQRKIDKIKKFVFAVMIGFTENFLSYLIGVFMQGLVVSGILVLIFASSNLITDTLPIKRLKLKTSDALVDSIYAKREPLYIITQRIKNAVDNLLSE